jgi:multidrug resistance protein MdtO
MFAWPSSFRQFANFLCTELAPFPGRANVTLRCVLGGAIVIVASMALQVPELPLSLLVIFYVTQSNIVLTRVVAVNLLLGVTSAVLCTILIYKLAFSYPLIRITLASAVFFCGVYLMRAVAKFGLVFYLLSLIVIYAQSFGDLSDNAEELVRSCLWVWVAVAYAVMTALVINTVFLPAEPERQLRAAMRRMLDRVSANLIAIVDTQHLNTVISAADLQVDVLTLQKLLRFTTMRRRLSEAEAAAMLSCIAAVSRIEEAAAALPSSDFASKPAQTEAIREVESELASLSLAIGDDAQWPWWDAPARAPIQTSIAAVDSIARALSSLADGPRGDTAAASMRETGASGSVARETPAEPALLQADMFVNPRYARFSLRTLLSVLICYVFYNAVKWPGIHTIMLTCLIVALPSLGASSRQGVLRLSGALIGSALALGMVSFVIPHLDSITGLLLMSLPVIALGAWISAGSERSGYAGIQIMFTFTLALLVSFAPPSDLTEIRDRIVGILLGVGVAIFVQTVLWPEGEGDALRLQLSSVLREIATLARANAATLLANSGGHDPVPTFNSSATWGKLADCTAMLARVALEPDWREGEISDVTVLSQTVLAQSRTLLLSLGAFGAEATSSTPVETFVAHAARLQSKVAEALDQYAAGLTAEPPNAIPPLALDLGALSAATLPFVTQSDVSVLSLAWHAQRIDAALSGLPRWSATVWGDVTQPVLG